MHPGLDFAAIADDFTGGTDLAGMLHEGGMPAVQIFGLPEPQTIAAAVSAARALVVSLKTRSIAPQDACALSLSAWRALAPFHPRQLQFKYCSTFDSTPQGNIGPVIDALMTALGVEFTVAVPALPVNGRVQFQGHLFVNGQLLSESPMRHHPLNPMTDSDLVRFLQAQSDRKVGLAGLAAVLAGPDPLREELERLRGEGVGIALVDAVREQDLAVITEACRELPLITGGSGFGRYIGSGTHVPPRPPGLRSKPALLLAGSCSEATLRQLVSFEQAGGIVLRARSADEIASLASAARTAMERHGAVCVASSAALAERTGDAPESFERAFAALARKAVSEWGVRGLVVAGGETSGAVIEAAGIRAGQVAGILAPGVPAMRALDPHGLYFVLKSGNFGGPDFFQRAVSFGEDS